MTFRFLFGLPGRFANRRPARWPGAVAATIVFTLVAGLAGEADARRYAAMVVDAATGETLHSRSADARVYPASLTKMMTLYMVYEALSRGELSLNQKLRVSKRAAGMPASKLGLRAGRHIRVKDAILALVTKSANDVAVVVAEALGGSEKRFARMMTEKARALGMKRTTFRNASGLPNKGQVTTARDMVRLASALLRDFPDYYRNFSTKKFKYGGRTYGNHNNLLRSYKGADGIKTGYINASGFNLAASAVRNGRRLIAVVFGGRTARTRDRQMVKLLNQGFKTLRTAALRKPAPVPPRKPFVFAALDQPLRVVPLPELAIAQAPQSPEPLAKAEPVASQLPKVVVVATQAQAAVPTPKPKPSVAFVTPKSKPTVPATVQPKAQPKAKRVAQPWGIQVGAYYGYVRAERAVSRAAERIPDLIGGTRVSITPVKGRRGRRIFRSRLVGLSEPNARTACRRLRHVSMDCMVVRVPRYEYIASRQLRPQSSTVN